MKNDKVSERTYARPQVVDRGRVVERTKDTFANGNPEGEGDNIVWGQFAEDEEE